MPPDRLADAARALGMRPKPRRASRRRCAALARLAYEVPPRILITGSLYLAGHVLALNGTPPRRTHERKRPAERPAVVESSCQR